MPAMFLDSRKAEEEVWEFVDDYNEFKFKTLNNYS